MANCLPGSESSAKRAETSAIRPEPFVMTMKFTTEITPKTVSPTSSEPPATNSAKPLMTWPAAVGPFWPCVRIRRVEDTFSDRRISSETKSRIGKAWKSVGFSTRDAMTRISVAMAIDSAMPMSSMAAGIGSTMDSTMITNAPVMISGRNGRDCAGRRSARLIAPLPDFSSCGPCDSRSQQLVDGPVGPGEHSRAAQEHQHADALIGRQPAKTQIHVDRQVFAREQPFRRLRDQRIGVDRHGRIRRGHRGRNQQGQDHDALSSSRSAFSRLPKLGRTCSGADWRPTSTQRLVAC